MDKRPSVLSNMTTPAWHPQMLVGLVLATLFGVAVDKAIEVLSFALMLSLTILVGAVT